MDNNRTDKGPYSKPISINIAATHRRCRSGSLSSDSSGGSPSDPIQTPLNANPPKVSTVSPSTSPILSYFMGQQPGSAKTLPFRRSTVDSIGSAGPVFDDGPFLIRDSRNLLLMPTQMILRNLTLLQFTKSIVARQLLGLPALNQ